MRPPVKDVTAVDFPVHLQHPSSLRGGNKSFYHLCYGALFGKGPYSINNPLLACRYDRTKLKWCILLVSCVMLNIM